MMKKIPFILLVIILDMVGIRAFAYDFAVKNDDGVTIYYNYNVYTGNLDELIVTYFDLYGGNYSGSVVIPENVTYMNRTYKVSRIGDEAFAGCSKYHS